MFFLIIFASNAGLEPIVQLRECSLLDLVFFEGFDTLPSCVTLDLSILGWDSKRSKEVEKHAITNVPCIRFHPHQPQLHHTLVDVRSFVASKLVRKETNVRTLANIALCAVNYIMKLVDKKPDSYENSLANNMIAGRLWHDTG